MKEELEQLINDLISKKGGSYNDYRLLMDKIAYHESKLDPRAIQLGGGPGRGKYQFEEGRGKGGKTAVNRAIRYYKENNKSIPKWLNNLNNKESIDASKLSNNQQDVLFLTNMIGHPKADFKDVITNTKPIDEFWADYHWAGNKGDRNTRLKSFNDSLKHFDKKYQSNIPNNLIELPKPNGLFNNPIEQDLMSPGIVSNEFKNGGIIDPPVKKPINPLEGIFQSYSGPGANYPLTFKKTKSKYHTIGANRLLQDRRPEYTEENNLSPSGEVVNFEKAISDPSAKAFLNRYNNPITRQRLAEQTNLSPYDIDNAILQGLTAKKEIGNEVRGSKASYYYPENLINMSERYAQNPSVETHERVHASMLDQALSKPLQDILGDAFQQKTRSFLKRVDPDVLRYLNQPHEAYGNFAEFREQIKLKPGEQIDVNELKKRVKKYGLNTENFYRAFDDDKIVEALNTIAQVDNNKYNNIT